MLLITQLIASLLLCCGLVVFGLDQGTFSINKPIMQPPDIPPTAAAATSAHQTSTTGSVRCFCNLPVCVSTGYMCKSSSGGCFSDLLHQSSPRSVYGGRHGCLELLADKVQRDWCQSNPNRSLGHKKKSHPKSLLLCCYRDMCNHADSPETTRVLVNETEAMLNKISSQMDTLGYSNSDVWFKAATIAVPICGAVILLVLIALAIRILRSESHSNTRHKLGATYLSASNKNNCGKLHEHYQTSQNLLHKEPMISTHHDPVYINHNEEIRQIRAPLIVQNELGNPHINKNTNVTVQYLPKSDYNHSFDDVKHYYPFNDDGKKYVISSHDLQQHKNFNYQAKSGEFDDRVNTYDKSKLKDKPSQ